MPLQDQSVIKKWVVDETTISAVEHNGKLDFYAQCHDKQPILIDYNDIVGFPSKIMSNPALWEKFLADTWVKLNKLSDGSFRLYINGRVKGAGNTIDPVAEPRKLWPKAIIPFEIDVRKYPVGENGRNIILQAIDYWRQADTGFTFVPRTRERDYVIFGEEGGVCYSMVGKNPNGGPQYTRCDLDGSGGGRFDVASMVHEIGHVIGLHHEQTRSDSDQYVWVNEEKIYPRNIHNFFQSNSKPHGPYDYDSIMHYGRKAFSIDGTDTIVPSRGVSIGQRNHLSAGDIAAARYLATKAKNITIKPIQSNVVKWQPYRTQQEFSQATIAYETNRVREPVWKILRQQAEQHLQSKNYQYSALYFQALITEYGDVFHEIPICSPQQAIIYDNYGISLGELGNYQTALKYFTKALQLDSNNPLFSEHIEIAEDYIYSAKSSTCTTPTQDGACTILTRK